jgi:hypothetical protein
MCESCYWCKSPKVDRHWETTEGRKPICLTCLRAMRKRCVSRRTRSKPQNGLPQPLLPLFQNENGSVLCGNIRAGKV